MQNLTLGREGTQFHGDGVSLAWPKGGKAQIVPAPPELSVRVKRRIAEGFLVQTDAEPTHPAWVNPASRILTGEEARRRLDGPPVVEVSEAAIPEAQSAVAVAEPQEKEPTDGQRLPARGGRTSPRGGGGKA